MVEKKKGKTYDDPDPHEKNEAQEIPIGIPMDAEEFKRLKEEARQSTAQEASADPEPDDTKKA